jgi:hypothetical protein
MFYVISSAVGELSEKELAAAASATMTMTTKFILTIIIKEVYTIAWKSFSIKERSKRDQKKRFQLHEAIGIILYTLL